MTGSRAAGRAGRRRTRAAAARRCRPSGPGVRRPAAAPGPGAPALLPRPDGLRQVHAGAAGRPQPAPAGPRTACWSPRATGRRPRRSAPGSGCRGEARGDRRRRPICGCWSATGGPSGHRGRLPDRRRGAVPHRATRSTSWPSWSTSRTSTSTRSGSPPTSAPGCSPAPSGCWRSPTTSSGCRSRCSAGAGCPGCSTPASSTASWCVPGETVVVADTAPPAAGRRRGLLPRRPLPGALPTALRPRRARPDGRRAGTARAALTLRPHPSGGRWSARIRPHAMMSTPIRRNLSAYFCRSSL